MLRHQFAFFFFALLLLGCDGRVVMLDDYMDGNMDGDATPAFRSALEECRRRGSSTLVIPKGEYHVYPDLAAESYRYVSNNSPSLKRILLDVDGMHDLKVEGSGARIVCHGFLCPLMVRNSRHIILRNITIDFARTFHTEADIVEVGEDHIDLRFPSEYPYELKRGELHFCDDCGTEYPVTYMVVFDSLTHEPCRGGGTFWIGRKPMKASLLENDVVRLRYDWFTGRPGERLVFGAADRYCPAVTIDHSEDVLLENVTINHAGAMGVVGQMSNDIVLRQVGVLPAEGRYVSVTADATHFTQCGGKLILDSCEFRNQLDDASNIHGIYSRIERLLPDGSIYVSLQHATHLGLDLYEPGDEVEVVAPRNLMTRTTCRVTHVVRLNEKWTQLVLENATRDSIAVGDLLAPCRWPDVEIRHCDIGGNTSRGLLLGSRRSTLIEGCIFHTAMPAILFEGDGHFWYEQAGARNVDIRNNTFSHCLYGPDKADFAVIASGNGPEKDRLASAYNRNISIEGNRFILDDERLLNVFSVDSLVMQGNTFVLVDSSSSDRVTSSSLSCKIADSKRVHISD